MLLSPCSSARSNPDSRSVAPCAANKQSIYALQQPSVESQHHPSHPSTIWKDTYLPHYNNYVGGSTLSIPAKLVKCIQEGQLVKMVELMPEYLSGFNLSDEDQLKSSKFKNREITNIVVWIQCFSWYIAIVCQSQPQRVVDLLGYQNPIITSHQQFPDFNWATYDCEFHQQAAGNGHTRMVCSRQYSVEASVTKHHSLLHD